MIPTVPTYMEPMTMYFHSYGSILRNAYALRLQKAM